MTVPVVRPNGALIQDEVLGEIALVLHGGKPAGPTFVHSIGSLVEACVLHEDVFVRATRELEEHDSSGTGLGTLIEKSHVASQLLSRGVLKQFLALADVDDFLASIGSEYDHLEFATNINWTGISMLAGDSDGERRQWSFADGLLQRTPRVFETDRLTDVDQHNVDVPSGQLARDLVRSGIHIQDLVMVEGWNRQIGGLHKLTTLLGLNLYAVPTATLHHLGAVSATNTQARALYDQLSDELNTAARDEIGHANFRTAVVPPLAAITADRCMGDPKALPEVICELRQQHSDLRRFLTEFELAWAIAPDRNERARLRREFETAVRRLSEDAAKPHDRLIYQVWDIVKSPTEILKAIGDRLVTIGRGQAIVGKVTGLRAFWRAALTAPLRTQGDLCRSFTVSVAEPAVWEASERLARDAERSLADRVWAGA